MRITANMTSDNALLNIQNARSRIDRLNEQIASNKNILRPSDDPISVRNLQDLENSVKQSNQYTSNIDKASIALNLTDTALKGMTDIVKSIKSIVGTVVGGIDSSVDDQRRNAVSQLQELQKQLVDMGNTQSGDQYLFAGFKDNTIPFTLTSGALPYGYNGDSNVKNVAIARNSTIGMNINGDSVLMGETVENGVVTFGKYGNTNILGTLNSLITEISNNTDRTQIQTLAATFDGATNQLNNARGDVASKLMRLESTKNLLARDKNTMLGIISDRQNVDYAKAATEMNQEKTAFEAALSVTAKISQMSLLDYI